MDKLESEIAKLKNSVLNPYNFPSKFPIQTVQESAQNVVVLTASFYCLTKTFQRIAGVMRLHSARPMLAATSFGLLSVGISSALTFQVNESIPYITSTEEISSVRISENISNILNSNITANQAINSTMSFIKREGKTPFFCILSLPNTDYSIRTVSVRTSYCTY